jgi:hypothetical protein
VEKAPEKKQDIFASIFGGSAAKPATKKATPVKPVVEIKGKTALVSVLIHFSLGLLMNILSYLLAPVKPAAPITPPAAIKVEKKAEAKNDIFASLFGSAPAKQVVKKGEIMKSIYCSLIFSQSDISLCVTIHRVGSATCSNRQAGYGRGKEGGSKRYASLSTKCS